ncbi:curlin [Shewanella subflava]|uniref:Curlin n=1 Tax=Shewanella subflava TaxID=2986476 RepID=A0ABT3I6Z4_9GAMM|nr:curlin [Shewanella subflava]MCW3171829.1 curlin [Shewanella subflava]
MLISVTKTLCITLLLSSLALSAFAQEGKKDPFVDIDLPVTLQTLLENNNRGDMVNLIQLGMLNQASFLQDGEFNHASVLQLGDNNQAHIAQFGVNNEIELLQAGEKNTASIIQTGNDNRAQLNQLGSANFSIEQIADGAAITITQY